MFFLPEPPAGFDTFRDLRRRPGGVARAWSIDLHAEYRRAHDQRDAMLEICELEDVAPAAGWRLDRLPRDDEELARTARERVLAAAALRPDAYLASDPRPHSRRSGVHTGAGPGDPAEYRHGRHQALCRSWGKRRRGGGTGPYRLIHSDVRRGTHY